MKKLFYSIIFLLVGGFSFSACYSIMGTEESIRDYFIAQQPADPLAITAFAITSPVSATAIINTSAHTINITVPFATPVNAMTASFTVKAGSTVTIAATPQTSGTTTNDFSTPLTYTVTAPDSSTRNYTVTVTVSANTAKEITSYGFTAPAITGTISGTAISVLVPYSTDVTNLIAQFTYTGSAITVGVTPQTSSTTPNDFTAPVAYTVTAADASTQTYTVTVTKLPYHQVTYHGNGNTGGALPVDATTYDLTDTVTVLNQGTLTKVQDGITLRFTGWNDASNGLGTPYPESSTFNITGDITLYAQWDVIGGTGPGGGLVFYDKGNYLDGWRYLEAAPLAAEYTFRAWGKNTEMVSGTNTGIGTGKRNSQLINIFMNTAPAVTNTAAQIAENTNSGGFSDWFLPSRDEMQYIHDNLHAQLLGSFDGTYWTSSELTNIYPYYFSIPNGTFYSNNNKTAQLRLRQARAFRSVLSTWLVIYHGNGNTGGTVPIDTYHYESGESATIAGNTGTLTKTGHTFEGWNSSPNPAAQTHSIGNNYPITGNTVLYAFWSPVILPFARWTLNSSQNDSWNTNHLDSTPPYITNTLPGGFANCGILANTWVDSTIPQELGNQFSVSLWIYFNHLSGDPADLYTIIANSNSGITSDGFRLFARGDGSLTIETGDGTNDSSVASGSGEVAISTWYHITFVIDKNLETGTIYVDGVEIATGAVLPSFTTNSILRLGAMNDPGHYLDAAISDVRIYSNIITPYQIYLIRNGSL